MGNAVRTIFTDNIDRFGNTDSYNMWQSDESGAEDAFNARLRQLDLTRIEREVLYARYFEDMSLKDIAHRYGWPGIEQLHRFLRATEKKVREAMTAKEKA